MKNKIHYTTKESMNRNTQNRNARIKTVSVSSKNDVTYTANRDPGTMEAFVDTTNTGSMFSLNGLSLKTRGGRNIRFSGKEALTLLRLLEDATGSSRSR